MPKSLFTAKQHKFIARAIDTSRVPNNPTSIMAHWLISVLAFGFKQDNPKFDAESFRIDCGEKPVHSD